MNFPATTSAFDTAVRLDPPRPWIVLSTQPHRERFAVENIQNQNLEVYCPLIRRRIRHARKAMDVMRPLFPGYLFVAVDPDRDAWRFLLSTFGVRSVVRVGDRPSTLDNQLIEGLRQREVNGAIVKPVSPYNVGDKVKLSGGPFDSLIAEIISLDDNQRLHLLLNFLNGPVKVHVPVNGVVPVCLR